MSIVYYPEEKLSIACNKVDFQKISKKELTELYNKLCQNMIDYEGIGIAANQIGENHHACVIYSENFKDNHFLFLINPEILKNGKDSIEYTEGCLSFPSIQIKKIRHKIVTVKYQNIDGEFKEIVFKGVDSVCAQHEIDHLNGVTFIDNLTVIEKENIKTKILQITSMKKIFP